jgi:hypothetical protein
MQYPEGIMIRHFSQNFMPPPTPHNFTPRDTSYRTPNERAENGMALAWKQEPERNADNQGRQRGEERPGCGAAVTNRGAQR